MHPDLPTTPPRQRSQERTASWSLKLTTSRPALSRTSSLTPPTTGAPPQAPSPKPPPPVPSSPLALAWQAGDRHGAGLQSEEPLQPANTAPPQAPVPPRSPESPPPAPPSPTALAWQAEDHNGGGPRSEESLQPANSAPPQAPVRPPSPDTLPPSLPSPTNMEHHSPADHDLPSPPPPGMLAASPTAE